ncbi:MAG: glycosyltransferase family 2 protein [Alphaproteobacteria bacterium]|nr:glycosyltransferase family 2 protein [Alphaproteobacteria bacterium]
MAPLARITEVAFTKNEGRFLLEWIAYHRLIGVRDFLIYTNDCDDESPALLERLEELGLVAHRINPTEPGKIIQKTALDDALHHPLVTGADWVLQIDPDEFLCIKTGAGRLDDLIATAPGADIIAVQMRFFGDSGRAKLDDGLVTEQLTRASRKDFAPNGIVKSLARNVAAFDKITANHMPGMPESARVRIFNGGGAEVPAPASGSQRFRVMPEASRSMKFAQLNHYAVRTFADYRAKKYRGTAADNDKKLTLAYWNQRNRNEVEDLAIAPHIPAVKALMAQWLADPVLAARNRRCFEAYAEIVTKAEGLLALPK